MLRLVDKIRAHSGFLKYAVLSYMDKGLAFATPLALLWITGERTLYNQIEYVYSIAAIVAVVIELGVKNYALYAYKEARDRNLMVAEVKTVFLIQFSIYACTAGLAGGAIWLVTGSLRPVIFFVTARTLSAYFISFFAIYYRLVDRPSTVFAFSIGANILTLVVLALANALVGEGLLYWFFVSQGTLVTGTVVYAALSISKVDWTGVRRYCKGALRYAWPIIINIGLFMGMSSYGRIYAQSYLGETAMFHISFVQRLALVIQIAHASAIGYLSKRLFVESGRAEQRKLFFRYSMMLMAASVAVFGLLAAMPVVAGIEGAPLDLTTFLIVAFTVMWCYAAFFELYLNRENRNRQVLLCSAIGVACFVSMLQLFRSGTLLGIVSAMTCGIAVNLFCLLTTLTFRSRYKMIRKTLLVFVGCLPVHAARIAAYRWFFRYQISNSRIGMFNLLDCRTLVMRDARIGNFNFVDSGEFIMEAGAGVGRMNRFRHLNSVTLGDRSQIVARNSFTGARAGLSPYDASRNLRIGHDSVITVGHAFDVTDEISIGDNVVVGGSGTQVWTHGFDADRVRIQAPVSVGNDIYVGSHCFILQGVRIADRVSIGAGTVVAKEITESGFYVSSQLIRKSPLASYAQDPATVEFNGHRFLKRGPKLPVDGGSISSRAVTDKPKGGEAE